MAKNGTKSRERFECGVVLSEGVVLSKLNLFYHSKAVDLKSISSDIWVW